ncbi:MAG TPA: PAS domain S-box protein, partial [Bryobacteraceae bacterium]|nr:PAS domain S-box protein [Bryobacteraceae bacterium]
MSSDAMRTNAFRLAAFLTPAVFLSGQSGAQAQKKYQIKLNHLNLQLTANTMELAAILLLLLLLAVAFALAAFAWRGMRVAKAANEKLSIETAERRRAEDATQAGKRLLQSVADNSPATIYIKDRAGRYLLVNRRYEELFHVRMEEMVGRTDYDLFSKETADVFRVMDRNVLAEGRALEGEEVAPLDDGPHIFHSVKFPLPNEAGEFYAVCGISTDITERKRGEAALRESQQRTLAIIDTALDGIITMNHNGQIVEFNPAAERIFGHRRGQVIGRNLAETIIPPRLREQHLRGLAQYLETGEGPVLGRRIELPGVRVDGTEFPLELSIARMPGEGPPLFTGFVRDVSERKEAEATRALLAGIVECSDDAIISKTLDGIVTSWNAGAETIFGYSSSEMIGTSINLLIPSDARNEETEILARIQRGDSISHYETVRLQKGGHRIHVSLAISPLKDAAGRIIGVSKTARDIGERKRAEQRLQAQLGRLSLLDHITHAIGQRQDLPSVFRVVLGTLEDSLPIDFGCVCLYDPVAETLTVSSVGSGSEVLAKELALTPDAQFAIDQNGLARCVQGHLVYEPDVSLLEFPFPQRISRAGLRSLVAAPLLSESNVFGVLVAARRQPHAFSSGDCEFLRQLSGHVALAAHHAQIYDALRQAYDDLRSTQQAVMEQERLRVMGQMASGIAHDINNALSPVALYTESLLEREPGLSARTREYLETTQRAIGDVSLTVGRMREFYRQREPQLLLMPVDLNGMVRQVLDLTRARWSDMAHQRGIVIQIRPELEPDLPAVAGIESEIREALTNLVFNAVDAMP